MIQYVEEPRALRYNMWKSLRPLGFLALELPRDNIHQDTPKRLFHILPFFRNPALVTGILLQPILPLGSILVNIPLGFYHIDSVNPSKLRRDLERMSDVTVTIFVIIIF